MKRFIPLFAFLMMLGCDNTAERAPVNLQKGDEYFDAKQYEVAQYYYEKIPEESPLYKQAQMKLQQIGEIEAGMLPKAPGGEEIQKLSIFDQSMTSNVDGLNPIHSVELNNESTFRLTSVTLEFAYYDANGDLVAVKQCKIPMHMSAKTQETLTGISPGKLDVACSTGKGRIVAAQFQ